MKDFLKGLRYVLYGARLLRRPGIRLFVIIPFLINSVLFAGVIVYGTSLISDLIDHLTSQWTWLEWVSWLLWPLFAMVALAVVFFCFTVVANLIAAPFNGFLAEAVEKSLSESQDGNSTGTKKLFAEILDALKTEVQKFAYFLLWAIPLLLMFVIPVIQAVAPLLWLVFGAWMLALEYLEFPMGNHGKLFPEIREIVRKNRPMAIGFGAGVLLFTMIPIVNFIAMPAAVSGATKLWLDHIKNTNIIS